MREGDKEGVVVVIAAAQTRNRSNYFLPDSHTFLELIYAIIEL